MRREEVNALGQLAGDAAADLAAQIQEVHAGIAQRAFGAVGPGGAMARAGHDRIAGSAYAVSRALSGAVVRASARAASVIPFLSGANHPFVCATVSRLPQRP
jgi:hypothetical protein